MVRLMSKIAAMIATAITMTMALVIMPVQALQVTVNADGVERTFELSVVTGSFEEIEETHPGRLTEAPWYGNEALAELVARQAITTGGLTAEGGMVFATRNGPNIHGIAWKPAGNNGDGPVGAAQFRPEAEINYVYLREVNDDIVPIPLGGGGGGAQVVPTPALLPGLVGLGIAAWRKRR